MTMRDLKLGSLFDGSGGFPLAGVLNGIEPVWASEIEPFPIRVTKARFPSMKHLGDVTKINGAEIEPVDIITFGSPCQDLSVAGKQLGIHDGQRSNLFFEAIRIIKEMREHDRATGRADDDIRPRFAVWENVPGAFSSNKGADFQAVLQAFCDIEGAGITVPMPPKGKWNPAGCIVGDGFSVAWRIYDAQYWGVPQRRKRIYLIADFGSERAGEILFECEGMPGNPEPGGKAREGTAEDAEGSAGRNGEPICLNFQGNKGGCSTTQDGTAYSLNAMHGHDVHVIADKVKCLNPWDCIAVRNTYNESGIGYWMPGFGCLRAEGENRPTRPNHVVVEDGAIACDLYNGKITGDKAATLMANSCATATRSGPSAIVFKEREGHGIGGKGLLNNSDKAYTCGTLPEQKVCYPINTMVATRGGKDDMRTCFGVGQSGDPQFTISAAHEHAVCYSIEGHVIDRQTSQNGRGWAEGYAHTLNATDRHAVCFAPTANYCGGYEESDVSETLQTGYHFGSGGDGALVCCLNDQGGAVMDVSDKAMTLRAQEHGHQPVVCYGLEPGAAQRQNVENRYAENVSPTLRANAGDNRVAVVYSVENRPADSRVNIIDDGKCQTLTSRMGTGGGNVPMILMEVTDE